MLPLLARRWRPLSAGARGQLPPPDPPVPPPLMGGEGYKGRKEERPAGIFCPGAPEFLATPLSGVQEQSLSIGGLGMKDGRLKLFRCVHV